MRSLTSLKLLPLAALAAACSVATPESGQNRLTAADQDAAAKAAWIEKAAAALRNGDGIGPKDDLDQLLEMSREDVVKKFMDDPRFGDTVLAFNLFYLGRSVNTLKTAEPGAGPGGKKYRYDEMAFAVPQALASARAVMEGGDFYELYSAAPAIFLAPLKAPQNYDIQGQPISGTDAEKREKIRQGALKIFDDALAATPAAGQTPKLAVCQKFEFGAYNIQNAFTYAGFDDRLGQLVYQTWIMPLINYFPPGDCRVDAVTVETVKEKLTAMRAGVDAIFAKAQSLPSGGGIKHLGELAKLDVATPGLASLATPLTVKGFWEPLRNSSTNYNRKRAAYMLRTYFCDDLTPIAQEIMQAPAGSNKHATDPACQACHYKLDPMGALFRDFGQNGTNYAGQSSLTFDDFKTISGSELESYLSTWKGQDGKYMAGYYVGAKKPHAKWKGDKLEDMWAFLPQAPEAKQCLVRRMAEYFLGPAQVYDGGWLDQVSKSLKPGPSSAAAVKDVIKSLVLSKTFSTQNPEPGKCYDFAADDDSAQGERAPCEVASIVKKRCANCHSDASETGVDFTTWKKLSDGNYGWPHNDGGSGPSMSQKDSFKRILERLTSADPLKRMPKGGTMPEMERQVLYKWLDKQVNPGN